MSMMAGFNRLLVNGLMLCWAATTLEAQSSTLMLRLSTTKATWSSGETVQIDLTLQNGGSSAVAIPVIGSACPAAYFQLQIVDQFGASVFFVPTRDDEATGLTASSAVLASGQSVHICSMTMNDGGLGFFKTSIAQSVSGVLNVTASFSVTQQNGPRDLRSNIFLGTITSSSLVINIISTQTGDLNADGRIDCNDVSLVEGTLGRQVGQGGFDARADVNQDGTVNIKDLAFVAQKLLTGTRCSQ
jgi:Dockerin type I domain